MLGGTSGRCEGPPARSVGGRFARIYAALRERARLADERGQCPDRGRRLVRDYETIPATHEAMIWTAATWQAQQPPHPLTQFTGALLRQRGRRYARGGCPAVQVGAMRYQPPLRGSSAEDARSDGVHDASPPPCRCVPHLME